MLADDGSGPPADVEVVHSSPMILLPDEISGAVAAVFDVICIGSEVCEPSVEVHWRAAGSPSFVTTVAGPLGDGDGRWAAAMPEQLSGAPVVEYFAETTVAGHDGTVTLPEAGAAAPFRMWVATDPVEATFEGIDSVEEPDEVAVSGGWGTGEGDFAFEGGGLDSDRIGPSAIAVDARGRVSVLDQFNQRVQTFEPGGPMAARVSVTPVQVGLFGGTPDVAAAPDGSLVVLEWGGDQDRRPKVRRFRPDGQQLDVVPIAARRVDDLHIGTDGDIQVHGYPGDHWLTVGALDVKAGPQGSARLRGLAQAAQQRSVHSGRTFGDSRVVLRGYPDEIRVAEIRGDRLARSWRVVDTDPEVNVGEIHVVDVRGPDLLLGLRLWTEDTAVYRMMRVRPDGSTQQLTASISEWTDAAPVSRLRLSPAGDWYQLRTDPAGLQVVRFDARRTR